MSIRTVQTSFTSQPSWSAPSPSSSVLHTVSMNHPSVHLVQSNNRKFPPGLGYTAPAPQHAERVGRRRSGSFTYSSGNTYASGNVNTGPHASQGPRGRRPTSTPTSRLSYVAADPFRVTAYGAIPSTIKFDPFANDEDLTPSEPIYNHYWQYNPTTNSPELVYEKPTTPVKTTIASPSNNIPYTIKLPSASSPSLPTTISSPPPLNHSSRSTTVRIPQISSPPPPKPDRNARAKLVAGIMLNRIYAVGKPMRRRFSMVHDKAYVKSNLSSVVSVEC